MRGSSRFGSFLVVAAIGVAVAACGSSAASPSAPPAAADGSIAVSLSEWTVAPAVAESAAGSVTFALTNAGEQMHEFVVVKTDLAADALPIVDNKIDESALTPVDEVEDIAVGATPTLTVDLDPGHYVLLCNIETHYGLGMHADFTVK